MKKLITLALALTVICSLVGCGTTANSEVLPTVEGMEYEEFYGKITGVVGNEIEVALVKMPEIDEPAEEDGGNDGGLVLSEDAAMAAPAGDGAALGVGEGQNMEYTGETVTLTLPAGVKILNFGEESSLSALKKGNFVAVGVDNLEDMNVQVVRIME